MAFIESAMATFLACAARGPTTISAATMAAGLIPPADLNLRALGSTVRQAERGGLIIRVGRVSGSRPAAHGSPVGYWVTPDWRSE